jgi:ABC-type phosphate transport system substrate-binding protein
VSANSKKEYKLKVNKLIAALAVFGTGFAVFSTGATVQAEPVSNSYVVVGSDTIEDVLNALANGTAITGSTVRVTQNGSTIGSFDATGTPAIITKPGGVRFSRPNGSGEGFKALSSSIIADPVDANYFNSSTYQVIGGTNGTTLPDGIKNVHITGQVDIARSSSATPAGTLSVETNALATIVRVPFARDAIALAFGSTLSAAVCNAGQNSAIAPACVPYLTVAQIKAVFEGANTLTLGQTPPVDITIKGIIPQSGSGTRKDFESKAAIDTTLLATALTNNKVGLSQEHDATTLGVNEVAPMSASRWIAMQNKASFDKSGLAVIGSVYTTTTLGKSPVLGAAGSMTPNTEYYADTTWGRDTFLFVEKARVTSGNVKYDANLAALVDPTLNKLANVETTGASKAGKVKALFGLLAPNETALAYFVPQYVGKK